MDRITRVQAGKGESIAHENKANAVIDTCNAFGFMQVEPSEALLCFSVQGDKAVLQFDTVKMPAVVVGGDGTPFCTYVEALGWDDGGSAEQAKTDIKTALGLDDISADTRTFRATVISGGVATAETVDVYVPSTGG